MVFSKGWQGWMVKFFSWGGFSICSQTEFWLASLEKQLVMAVGPRTLRDDKHLQSWVLISCCIWPSCLYKVNREISPQQAFLWGGWHFLSAPLGTGMEGTRCWCQVSSFQARSCCCGEWGAGEEEGTHGDQPRCELERRRSLFSWYTFHTAFRHIK